MNRGDTNAVMVVIGMIAILVVTIYGIYWMIT